jgi:hypothetical protein
MVLTAYGALSPVIGLCCHRRRNAQALSPNASVEASGPHDFAVRFDALRLAASKASIASRIQRP